MAARIGGRRGRRLGGGWAAAGLALALAAAPGAASAQAAEPDGARSPTAAAIEAAIADLLPPSDAAAGGENPAVGGAATGRGGGAREGPRPPVPASRTGPEGGGGEAAAPARPFAPAAGAAPSGPVTGAPSVARPDAAPGPRAIPESAVPASTDWRGASPATVDAGAQLAADGGADDADDAADDGAGGSMAAGPGTPAVADAAGAAGGAAGAGLGPVTGLALPRYVSLRASEARVRRGPSLDHRVDWVYGRPGLPLRVTAEHGHWRRVEDIEGAGGWVHYSLISGSRTVIATEDLTPLLRRPAPDAALVARLEAGVIATLGACEGDWCALRAGGHRGWARREALWGAGDAPGDG